MDGWQAGLIGILVILGPVFLGAALVGLPVLLTAREHRRRYGQPLIEDWASVSASPIPVPDRDLGRWND
jgi:hypothetical protein